MPRLNRHRLVLQNDVPAFVSNVGACDGGYDVQSVDDTWDVTQDRQQDVDEEVGIAASLQEDTDGWQEDGKDDLADIAVQ